ncbi:MAG: tRNA uridine-5-carboxymethylaminomethyl(34) synthesis GTPase MnmE [Prevotellaceae bacterium]|jgi:tRNA modification GTPase|nr:tRNA uridine-5-carboxymethylaminomethyl(34) synthesis GTPase MnmE [Prevotellaceae bacterium]
MTVEHPDTITAISTPAGKGGIAVIRVSGTKAIALVEKIFVAHPAKKLMDVASHRLVFGEVHDNGEKIDEALVSVFRAPHSFTGENTVEISCHGSVYIQQRIVWLLLSKGARMAAAGEFTQRAFLNGKIDLAQAEAVADLIASESAAAHRVALQQLRGGFSEELRQLRRQLLDFVALIELELDFGEEEVEFADRTQLTALLQELQRVIGRLLQSFALGNAIKHGVPVAIIGHTNVGKSTLLNTLLSEERAIVSDIHGTTRDSIEETIQLQGITFRFIDTAGLRHTSETVEQMGIERTWGKIRQASIVLLLVDATRPDTFTSIKEVRPQLNDGQQLIVVVNKTDSATCEAPSCAATPVYISAKNKQGITQLTDALINSVNRSPVSADETVVTNLRHYEALQRTQEALTRAAQGFANKLPSDLIAQEVREALHHLGTITGEITTDEILGTIFSRFCIGK